QPRHAVSDLLLPAHARAQRPAVSADPQRDAGGLLPQHTRHHDPVSVGPGQWDWRARVPAAARAGAREVAAPEAGHRQPAEYRAAGGLLRVLGPHAHAGAAGLLVLAGPEQGV